MPFKLDKKKFTLDKKFQLDTPEKKESKFQGIPDDVANMLGEPNMIGASQNAEILEGIPAVGSGMLATPIAGLAALAELINQPDVEDNLDLLDYLENPRGDVNRLAEAGKTLEKVGGALTYEPRTEGGREFTELAAKPFEWWYDIATKYGDVGENKLTPALQTLIEVSPMAIPFLKKAGKKITPFELKKAKTPKQMAEGVESRFVKSEFEEAFLDKPKSDMVGAPKTIKPAYIEAAAIKMKDGTIYKAPTHHLAMEKYDAAGHTIRDWKKLVDDPDGFVTTEGKFVTREKANKLVGNKPGEIDATEIVGKATKPVKYQRRPTTLKGPEIMPKGKFTDLGEYKRVPTTLKGPEILPKGKFTDIGKRKRVPTKLETPRREITVIEKATGAKKTVDRGPYLYSGIPAREFAKVGKLWTEKVGTPIWDRLTFDKIPAFLSRVPGGQKVIQGGKFIKKQLDPDYRGNLPQTKEFVKSADQSKRNQAIGREYGIDLGQRLNMFSEQSQLKIGEFIRGEHIEQRAGVGKLKKFDLSPDELKVATEAVETLKHLGKQAVDAGLLSEEVYFKNWGRYMPRLYSAKEYTTLLERFSLPKPNRLDLSRFKKRKDIPKEIRKEMGEILTPGYPVAKGITQLTHDIELARFFNGVSKNPEWAIPKSTYAPKTPWTEPVKIPEGFMQLPKNKKLGALSDAYVHPEIFSELQQAVRVMETPERVWRKSLGYWKFGKVILSPKTHVRNLMSNSVLAHLGGMPMYEQPIYLTKAIKEMRGKGDYWKAAKQEGLMSKTWTSGELRELFNQVEGQMAGIKSGSVVDTMGVVGKAFDKFKKGMQKTANLYEFEEQLFKMAKMVHNIERRKMTPKAAAADAEKWLFNYSKVTPFQEKYRSKWYGAPFATFTFKALPRVMEAAVKTPWRFALPAGTIYALEQAAMSVIGDTSEQFEAKKELRPDWQQGKFMGVVPNFARFPFVDEHGREHYLNLTYILPWGDIAEGGDFMGIPGSVRPMSQPFVNELFQQMAGKGGYDMFWEEPIVKETDLAGKSKLDRALTHVEKRGKHLGQTMLPTPAIDISKGISALKGKPDYRGRMRDPRLVAADVFAGVKVYPVDYVDQLVRKVSEISPDDGYIAQKIKGEIKSASIKRKALSDIGKSTTFYDKLIESKIDQLKGMSEEIREFSETFKKIK